MPIEPDTVMWGSLLAACKVHGNLEMGIPVAEKLLNLDPSNSAPYVLLSNMYAELRMWKEVVGIRKLMRKRKVVKQPGCSWIEINNQVHVFMVKDKTHPRRREVYKLLKFLPEQMKPIGYVLDVGVTISYASEEPIKSI
ncbi:hypothetical protein ACHQM5_021556 [Ranunculus cassubicifolius]